MKHGNRPLFYDEDYGCTMCVNEHGTTDGVAQPAPPPEEAPAPESAQVATEIALEARLEEHGDHGRGETPLRGLNWL